MPPLSTRLARLPISATVQMSIRARQLQSQGREILALSLGEPNSPSPSHAIAAAHQAALLGETRYPPNDGTLALKHAAQRKFRRDSDLDYDLAEIAVCNGAKQVLANAMLATLNPGDEVIILAPYFGAYPLIVELAGGTPIIVECPQSNGFRPIPQSIARAITPATRWLMLNFPNNPSGAALTEADLAAIAEVVQFHPNIWILADDIYEHLIFTGAKSPTIAAVAPILRDRTLTVGSVSKSYAMTGWRIGFCGGPRSLIAAIVNMQSQVTSGACSIAQAAATAALDGPQDELHHQVAVYKSRRDMVVAALQKTPGVTCHAPDGAFYVFPNIDGWIGKTTAAGTLLAADEQAVLALLDEQNVATVHGAAFGMSPYLRISTAADEATLAEACRRIAAFAQALR